MHRDKSPLDMTVGARDLALRVLPHVPIRRWVLSLPFALRVRLALDHDTTLALWRIVEAEIDRRYLGRVRKVGIARAHPRPVAIDVASARRHNTITTIGRRVRR